MNKEPYEFLYQSTEEKFWQFVKENNLQPKEGTIVHSTNYVDENNQIRAYHETSSWCMEETFLIDVEPDRQLETIEFVGNLIKNKMKYS